MFPEQLATATTRHQGISMSIDAGNGNKLSATGADQTRDQPTLSTKRDTISGVLNIAPCDNSAIIN
jgi:hypothetical protein